MSNRDEGREHYANSDDSTRLWFERQWAIWPERADERFTTNMSFHYGGVCAFREANGCDPVMSKDFASHVAWHDRHSGGGDAN
ncbi:hypothetical protein SP5_068_00900 [Sphingomonas parapaucimobilis NBRC 15100]|uniref:Uncharacterized protein n=1 Tax=Sphingomonas parapaucimobilis NBRC 15100 TaxID=1219049 RepID=A0A0A1W974_9SPHN|nr:hypothetical protein SP5_068_00900 [Sphingomonas parapaucimobilis NBRC 15100]